MEWANTAIWYEYTWASLNGYLANMVDGVLRVGNKRTKEVVATTAVCVRQRALHEKALSKGGSNSMQMWALYGVFTACREVRAQARLPFAVRETWK